MLIATRVWEQTGDRQTAGIEDFRCWHSRRNGQLDLMSGFGRSSEADGCVGLARRDANDPNVWSGRA
jgi:hypothetical protein